MMFHPYLLQANSLSRILLASLALIAVVVFGLVIVSQVKKRLNATEDKGQPGGFTLSDLRALHRDGRMSDEEFARAKEMVVQAARRASERDAAGDQRSPHSPDQMG